MPGRLKRKRGGQPGNQNARKHGFYSSKMDPDEVCRFWNIVNLKGIEPEVVAFRLKLHSVLKSDPGNHRTLIEAVKMITRYYKVKFRMTKSETNAVRRKVKRSVEQYVTRSLSSPVDRPELSGEILHDESRSFYG
jgi:hypothetical protein